MHSPPTAEPTLAHFSHAAQAPALRVDIGMQHQGLVYRILLGTERGDYSRIKNWREREP